MFYGKEICKISPCIIPYKLFSGIVGISKDGDTLIYNGLIVKHWQKTQTDEIKIKKVSLISLFRICDVYSSL